MSDSENVYSPATDASHKLIAYLSRYLFWGVTTVLLAGLVFML